MGNDMNEDRSSSQFRSRHEDRADLAVRAIATASRVSARRCGSCPPGVQLADFAAGTLPREAARETLLHLASCAACRDWESELHRMLLEQPILWHRLGRLRKQARVAPERVEHLLAALREWLQSRMIPAGAQPEPGRLLAMAVDANGKPEDCVEFEVAAGPAIDNAGRLQVTLAPVGNPGKRHLIVALQDADRRLEICALDSAEEEVLVVADCGFLVCGSGRLDPRAIHLTLTSMPVADWNKQRLLPHLRRIADLHLDPVDCWDAVSVALAEVEGDWLELLGKEVQASGSPLPGKAMARALAGTLQEFERIWVASNHEPHSDAAAVAQNLIDFADQTQYRRLGAKEPADPQPRLTERSRVKRPSEMEGENR